MYKSSHDKHNASDVTLRQGKVPHLPKHDPMDGLGSHRPEPVLNTRVGIRLVNTCKYVLFDKKMAFKVHSQLKK